MANKYLEQFNGNLREVEGLVSSSGAVDAGKIPALDASGRFDSTLMPTGVGADTTSIVASEDLVAGNWVNIWNDGGTPKVRKADATTAGKEAHGFVLSGSLATETAKVYFEGTNDQLSGMTPGATQFLSTTAGQNVEDVSSYVGGNIVQKLGVAISTTSVSFEKVQTIELV